MKKFVLIGVVLALCLALAGTGFAASANISFDQIPAGIKKPGVYMEQDISLASRALPSMARKVLVIGQRLGARVEPEIWQGGTLDDLGSRGTFTGTDGQRSFGSRSPQPARRTRCSIPSTTGPPGPLPRA